jgi:2-dehydro-3-deoxygalactonokinase
MNVGVDSVQMRSNQSPPRDPASTRAPRLIALDWGTSSLRAYLLGDEGAVLQERAEPWGIMHTPNGDFARAYSTVVAAWRREWPRLPALAAGMIGSAQGWREAPYVTCPAGAKALSAGLVEVAVGDGTSMLIVPGVLAAGAIPNVMRGEETQVIGAMDIEPALRQHARVVLPGTHSKWVDLRAGEITAFTTYMTGELFAVLREHSILGRPAQGIAVTGPIWPAFEQGVTAVRDSGSAGALPLLFSARTLVLTGRLRAEETLDYLSGLLIGEELRCALGEGYGDLPLVLVGDRALCQRYQRALQLFGVENASAIDNASIAGLWRIAITAGLIDNTTSGSSEQGPCSELLT